MCPTVIRVPAIIGCPVIIFGSRLMRRCWMSDSFDRQITINTKAGSAALPCADKEALKLLRLPAGAPRRRADIKWAAVQDKDNRLRHRPGARVAATTGDLGRPEHMSANSYLSGFVAGSTQREGRWKIER
jgi:hypothetical protein